MTALLQALQAVGVPHSNAIAHAFLFMEVAERAMLPGDPPGTFLLLRPTSVLVRNVRVYQAHVRELLERVRVGEDTRPGTTVEVLCGVMKACSLAPLTRAAQGLCEHLWPQVMGAPVPDSGDLLREQWPGQWAEDLADARRACRQGWRKLPG